MERGVQETTYQESDLIILDIQQLPVHFHKLQLEGIYFEAKCLSALSGLVWRWFILQDSHFLDDPKFQAFSKLIPG